MNNKQENYVAPEIAVVELETEGVLCASGGEGVFDEFYEQGI